MYNGRKANTLNDIADDGCTNEAHGCAARFIEELREYRAEKTEDGGIRIELDVLGSTLEVMFPPSGECPDLYHAQVKEPR